MSRYSPLWIVILALMTLPKVSNNLVHSQIVGPENGLMLNGIPCDKVEHLVFHNHTKLNVIVNNESYTIPEGIGIIPNECIYWLHTHDTSGIIHVESPVKNSFTLGQFLSIWKAFDNSNLTKILAGNNFTDASIIISVDINGKQLDSEHHDYTDTKLGDNDEISLRITAN